MSRFRLRFALALLTTVLSLLGCQKQAEPSAGAPERAPAPATVAQDSAKTAGGLTRARAENPRKVVYKAELSVEVRSPSDAQAKIAAVAEREGGFVASAARAVAGERPADVTLVVRVPAERFHAVVGEIRRLGDGKQAERIDSEDVTDEWIDLDARLRVQTRLEEQLLELLKTATSVQAALEVHKELASVRTEIERIQGRKQLIERDVALATIRVTLSAPAAERVSFSRIGASFSDAYDDAILVGGGMIVLAIRSAGVLVPIALLMGVPGVVALLLVRRRMRRARSASAATVTTP